MCNCSLQGRYAECCGARRELRREERDAASEPKITRVRAYYPPTGSVITGELVETTSGRFSKIIPDGMVEVIAVGSGWIVQVLV